MEINEQMKYQIPINEDNLTVLLSPDSYEKLFDIYNLKRRTINGRTISDIAQVWEQLVEWDIIDRHCLKIPFKFGHPRNEPRGYRIWYLSLPANNGYYHGNFFDLKITETKRRIIRRQCKLSKAAIILFKTHSEIIQNKEIKG